jgi:hypothetical protein
MQNTFNLRARDIKQRMLLTGLLLACACFLRRRAGRIVLIDDISGVKGTDISLSSIRQGLERALSELEAKRTLHIVRQSVVVNPRVGRGPQVLVEEPEPLENSIPAEVAPPEKKKPKRAQIFRPIKSPKIEVARVIEGPEKERGRVAERGRKGKGKKKEKRRHGKNGSRERTHHHRHFPVKRKPSADEPGLVAKDDRCVVESVMERVKKEREGEKGVLSELKKKRRRLAERMDESRKERLGIEKSFLVTRDEISHLHREIDALGARLDELRRDKNMVDESDVETKKMLGAIKKEIASHKKRFTEKQQELSRMKMRLGTRRRVYTQERHKLLSGRRVVGHPGVNPPDKRGEEERYPGEAEGVPDTDSSSSSR